MKRALGVAALFLLGATAACGTSVEYKARPIDAQGRCFLIERTTDNGTSSRTYPQGRYCKEDDQ